MLPFDEASLFSNTTCSDHAFRFADGWGQETTSDSEDRFRLGDTSRWCSLLKKISSLHRHTRAWWQPEHQNPTEGIGPFFLLYLQPQNAATANPQQVHHSSGSLHTTSAQNNPRSSTQASTLSSVGDYSISITNVHSQPLQRIFQQNQGSGSHTHSSPPSTSQTSRVVISHYTSCSQWTR
jgi:hypothetical protein